MQTYMLGVFGFGRANLEHVVPLTPFSVQCLQQGDSPTLLIDTEECSITSLQLESDRARCLVGVRGSDIVQKLGSLLVFVHFYHNAWHVEVRGKPLLQVHTGGRRQW